MRSKGRVVVWAAATAALVATVTAVTAGASMEGSRQVVADGCSSASAAAPQAPLGPAFHESGNWMPTWSPDGTKIAFLGKAGGKAQIWIMDANGTNQRRLTSSSRIEFRPHWQPDGSRIAFTSNRDGNQEIYVINVDGSGETRLTNNPARDHMPKWSPDGRTLAFVSDRDGNLELYTMNADGSGVTRLTNYPGDDVEPDWSPDGKRIAFSRQVGEIFPTFVMNADGSGARQLHDMTSGDPSWSPNGLRLALAAMFEPDNLDLAVMASDGSGMPLRLTRTPGTDCFPDWAPSGRRIAFASQRNGPATFEIYLTAPDGSHLQAITGPEANPSPQLRLAAERFAVSPARPRQAKTFRVAMTVFDDLTGADLSSASVSCKAKVRKRALRPTIARFAKSRATCAWNVPPRSKGKSLRGSIAIRAAEAMATRSFSYRIG